LQKAFDLREPTLPDIGRDLSYDPIRSDPCFQDLEKAEVRRVVPVGGAEMKETSRYGNLPVVLLSVVVIPTQPVFPQRNRRSRR